MPSSTVEITDADRLILESWTRSSTVSAPDDGRSVIVVATDRAAEIFDTFARTRLAALEAIMARLDQPDRDQIEAALPAMERLLHEFDAELQRIDHLPPEGEKESTDD